MDADKVREIVSLVKWARSWPGRVAGVGCLADACEALLAERDKLIERNWYLEHDKQHDVLKLQERIAELEAALSNFRDAWENATYGFDGMASVSCDNLEAASQLAAELLAKKEVA